MLAAACGDDGGRASATMTEPTSLTNVVFTTGIASYWYPGGLDLDLIPQ